MALGCHAYNVIEAGGVRLIHESNPKIEPDLGARQRTVAIAGQASAMHKSASFPAVRILPRTTISAESASVRAPSGGCVLCRSGDARSNAFGRRREDHGVQGRARQTALSA